MVYDDFPPRAFLQLKNPPDSCKGGKHTWADMHMLFSKGERAIIREKCSVCKAEKFYDRRITDKLLRQCSKVSLF